MAAAATSTDPRLRDRAIARTLPYMPRRLVQRVSAPYIAGEHLDDAIATVRRLSAAGFATTVDVLGEAISTRAEAEATRDAYVELIAALADARGDRREALDDVRNVSVKLTALGLGIDDELVHETVADIARAAAGAGGFVRIDMEDSPYTDATLGLFDRLRSSGHHNLGVVLQACLRRTGRDAERLAATGARVRMVKGIYLEPETIALCDPVEVERSFLDGCRTLAAAGCHVAFATHDDRLIAGCLALVHELGIPRERYEFQTLLGVRERRRDELLAAGHPVRVYVPYGARWYEYSLRRLRENPRVAGHVASDVIAAWTRRLRGERGGGSVPQ